MNTVYHNIGIFVPNYNAGGTEKVAVLLAEYFNNKGFKVILISLSPNEYPYETNLPVINIDSALPKNRILRFFYRQTILFKIIRKHQLNSILSMGEYPNFLVATLPTLDVRRINRYTNSSVSLKGFKGHIIKLLNRIAFYLSSNTIVPASRLAEELLLPKKSKRLSVIPNPVDQRKIRARAQFMHKYFAESCAESYFIHVGQLVYQKNHDFLLRNYSRYLQEGGNLRLKVLGKGPLEDEIKSTAVNLGIFQMIDFVGWMRNPYPLMKNASALLLTSRWEGIPNVMIEAMSLGVPIVSVDCPTGPREVLDQGRFGILVPPNNGDAFVHALFKIERDEELSKELSRLSFTRSSEYSLERIGDRFVQLLEKN